MGGRQEARDGRGEEVTKTAMHEQGRVEEQTDEWRAFSCNGSRFRIRVVDTV